MLNNFLLSVLAALVNLSVILFINSKISVIAILFLILKAKAKTAITIIALLSVGASLPIAEYIQPIGFCIGTMCLVPVKPADGKSSRRMGLSKAEKESISLTQELKDILIGLCLGDINIQKQGVNARLMFSQGTVHKDYLDHLYSLFKDYCSSEPKVFNMAAHKVTGLIYSRVTFYTYSLPCLNELYELFYSSAQLGCIQKIVPVNIKELLTPLSLAYWLADDGSFCKTNHIVLLHTQGFTKEEAELLAKTLNEK